MFGELQEAAQVNICTCAILFAVYIVALVMWAFAPSLYFTWFPKRRSSSETNKTGNKPVLIMYAEL